MENANNTVMPEHQIFVLDAYLAKPLDCSLRTAITKAFIKDTLNVFKLKALGPMQIYSSVDERAPGWSFIQPIASSHISAHYFEKPGRGPYIRVDAYSCDSIDWLKLLNVCHQHFSLTQWRGNFIERAIDFGDERAVLDLAGIGNSITTKNRLDTESVEARHGTTAIGIAAEKLAAI